MGEERNKSLRDFPETIGAVARHYNEDLGLEEVSSELGAADPELMKVEIRKEHSPLRKQGLEPLLEGGTISARTGVQQKP